jgi:hypothetical protein
MFGARALRKTARRVREGKVGRKEWGTASGVNDTPKLLASLALFVCSTAAGRMLQAVLPEGIDASLLLWIAHAVASFAACRVVFFVARRPTLRLLLRVQPWAEPQPQHSPLGVAVWEVALALLQPGNASTAFLERVLPSLPIPSVHRAVQRHLDALEPVASAKARDAAGTGARELLRVGSIEWLRVGKYGFRGWCICPSHMFADLSGVRRPGAGRAPSHAGRRQRLVMGMHLDGAACKQRSAPAHAELLLARPADPT